MTDAVLLRRIPYPQGTEYANSTDYFRNVVTSKIMNVSFSFFSAPNVPPPASETPADFTASNNAWCIVSDIMDTTKDGTPVLFTRNVSGTILTTNNTLTETMNPFGDKGAVVVQKGGSALALRSTDISISFNPVAATNTILRPGTGF
jgi:hypothetical protein